MLVGRAFQCTTVLGEEVILVVIGSSRYLSVCQRVDKFSLSVVRYEVVSRRNCNNVILCVMTRRLSIDASLI